jgi:hypothetical protein
MGSLFPGLGIWFCEIQNNGQTKVVPGVVLHVGRDRVVVARDTSQSNDTGGFTSIDAISLSPNEPCGVRLRLSLVTRFRSDDVKVIAISSIERICSQMSRGTWKQIRDLTRDAVRRLAERVEPTSASS